jgi:hypothetical protein
MLKLVPYLIDYESQTRKLMISSYTPTELL